RDRADRDHRQCDLSLACRHRAGARSDGQAGQDVWQGCRRVSAGDRLPLAAEAAGEVARGGRARAVPDVARRTRARRPVAQRRRRNGDGLSTGVPGLRRTIAAHDGYSLTYRAWPPSPAPRRATVVLLNGVMSHSAWFAPLAERLAAAGFHVVGADRRG